MLSDIILIGNNKAGSFALADTKQSMLSGALQAQLQNIADVFNSKAIPDLFSYNSFPGITELPKIVPGQIQAPSLKELALVLRAAGVNTSGDIKTENYSRHIVGIPALDEETYKQVYQSSSEEQKLTSNKEDVVDDKMENVFEQSDMHYTGGEL